MSRVLGLMPQPRLPPARAEFLGMNARLSFHYGEHLGCGPGFTVINLAPGVLSLKISSLPYGVARLLRSMSQCPRVRWIHGSLQGVLGTSPGIVGSVGLDKRRMTRIQHYSIIQNGLSALKILWVPPSPHLFIHPSLPASPRVTTCLFTVFIFLPFPECHIMLGEVEPPGVVFGLEAEFRYTRT